MKFPSVFALFAIASVSAEGESKVRLGKRELASAGGSVNVPTCFSEVATVQVFGKGAVEMKDLRVGDRIFTGETYQSIYAFAHLDKTTKADFVQIHTENGKTFEATGAHLVYVDGKASPVRTDAITVGDFLQGAVVAAIGSIERSGLYAPLTVNGKLIVSGVKASNYVSLEQIENHALFESNVHGFSQFGISPFRLLCTRVSYKMCESYNDEGIPALLAFQYQVFQSFMELPGLFRTVALAIYLCIAALTWTMECLLQAPVACAIMAAVGAMSVQAMGIRLQAKKTKTL